MIYGLWQRHSELLTNILPVLTGALWLTKDSNTNNKVAWLSSLFLSLFFFFFLIFLLHLNNKGRLFTNASGSKKEYTNRYCPDMSRTAYCTPLANNHSGCNIQSVVVLVWHTVKIYTGVGFVWNQISNVAISVWHPRNDHWIDSHHRNEPMVIDSIKFNYQQAIHGCDFHMYRFYCGETHLQRRSSVAVVYSCKAAEIWGSIE